MERTVKHFRFFVLVLLLVPQITSAQSARAGYQISGLAAERLRVGFAQPPDAAKLRCYWWWLNGNTTAETITRDLEGMKAKGFGGAILVDADGSGTMGNREVHEGPAISSPQWIALFVHALGEAQRLGLEISLNVTSRWDVGIIGGQTVKPEDAIKMLTWSRKTVDGGGARSVQLFAPPVENHFSRPIAVLAYPLHRGEPLAGMPGSHRLAISDLALKAAAKETGISMPQSEDVMRISGSKVGEEDAEVNEVVDLSVHLGSGGKLKWDFPAGQWEVLLIGYTNSGKKLADTSGQVHGLPLDVLSAKAFDNYWQQAIMPLLDAATPYIGKSLRYLVTDSWEAGGLDWTDNFREEFRRRRGYDPVVYLPIVTGRILSNREMGERFLFDLRRTVADLITENYYDRFAEKAKKVGLGTHPESGGPHGAPIDALETFRNSSFPQTEYWADSNGHRASDVDRFFVKEAASAANIYGKPFVAAEGPTSMNRVAWSEALATNVQPAIDRAFTEGLNRIFWHEFTSSPAVYGKPGQEYFAGTHLNPNVTWWEQSGPFLRALNRVQYMMQQGRPVNDLLYFYGDQVPSFVRMKSDDPARLLSGYDYDVTGEDALLHRMQFDAAGLRTPEGIRYRALALPSTRRISLAALVWVERYVGQGGTVIGLKPEVPLGILPPDKLAEYERIVGAVWAGCANGVAESRYGEGRVFCTATARTAFAKMGITADVSYTVTAKDAAREKNPVLDYVHRTTGGVEIYFVRNTQPRAIEAMLSFRVRGRAPELWTADDGSTTPAAVYRETADARTEIPLAFPAYGSVFIVFAHSSADHLTSLVRDGRTVFPSVHQGGAVYSNKDAEPVATVAGNYRAIDSRGREHIFTVRPADLNVQLDGQWTLSFPATGSEPVSIPVTRFESWTESKEPDIRYFSGTAVYRSTLHVPAYSARPLWLQLGEVREIATVKVNGVDAGTVWRAPYAVRIGDQLKAGDNVVDIEVSNLWPNRLIGDARLGEHKRYTNTNVQAYGSESPLLPSGILQPVSVQCGYVLDWRVGVRQAFC